MITKTGLVTASNFNEFTAQATFDKNIYVEPDGSLWIRVLHHNNPASNLFSVSDDFTNGVYKDANRWFDFAMCRKMSTCEFMAKQAATSGATEVKCRWIQTKNPWVSTYNDVKPSAVTRITTTGYTNNTTYGGGLYSYSTTSNTRFVIANTTSGNWWGATGCWTAYQGGIPGANGTVCTTGYFDIYLKIDYNIQCKVNADNIWFSSDLIEY